MSHKTAHSTREIKKKKDSPKTIKAKASMIEALKQCLGVVTDASQMSGVPRRTHYDWMKDDKEYKDRVESIGEEALDFVESKLFETINGVVIGKETKTGFKTYTLPPDVRSIMFYLKTKGKKRGYVERVENEISTPGEFSPKIIFTKKAS